MIRAYLAEDFLGVQSTTLIGVPFAPLFLTIQVRTFLYTNHIEIFQDLTSEHHQGRWTGEILDYYRSNFKIGRRSNAETI